MPTQLSPNHKHCWTWLEQVRLSILQCWRKINRRRQITEGKVKHHCLSSCKQTYFYFRTVQNANMSFVEYFAVNRYWREKNKILFSANSISPDPSSSFVKVLAMLKVSRYSDVAYTHNGCFFFIFFINSDINVWLIRKIITQTSLYMYSFDITVWLNLQFVSRISYVRISVTLESYPILLANLDSWERCILVGWSRISIWPKGWK